MSAISVNREERQRISEDSLDSYRLSVARGSCGATDSCCEPIFNDRIRGQSQKIAQRKTNAKKHRGAATPCTTTTMDSSSGLFAAPFTAAEGLQQRRVSSENDSFAEYAPTESFTARSRRRRRSDSAVVGLAMKAVLLSPVVVLAIWSLVAVVFTKKQQPKMQAVRIPKRPTHKTRLAALKDAAGGGLLEVVEVVESAMGETQPKVGSRDATIVRPRPDPHPRANLVVQPMETQQLEAAPMAAATQQAPMQTASAMQAPMQTATAMQAPMQAATSAQQPMETATAVQQPIQAVEQAPMTAAKQPSDQLVFYYRPSEVEYDGDHVVLPAKVYDSHGRLHDLAAVAKDKHVYLEPPTQHRPRLGAPLPDGGTSILVPHVGVAAPAMSASQPLMGVSQQTSPQVSAVEEAEEPKETLPDMTSAADQSIIIGTVGVMALLIGAVSARRLRSRSILAACIENETLDEQVAYDSASSYRTFEQGWKGDLEKFDV